MCLRSAAKTSELQAELGTNCAHLNLSTVKMKAQCSNSKAAGMSSHWKYAWACGLVPVLVAIPSGWFARLTPSPGKPYILQWLNLMLFFALPWAIAAAFRYLLPFRVVRILAFCSYGILGLMWLATFFNIFGLLAVSIRHAIR